jgi:lipid-binding SYLF domain-containing protein
MKIFNFAAAACVAAALATSAASADPYELVTHATQVAEHMKSDPAFNQAQNMVQHARAVLIVPALVKGGFIFGAEGGDGVLLRRIGSHSWSSPAFYTMGSASFGLQIGIEKAEIVLLIMSDRALAGIEQNEFKIGAGAGITAITLSSGAEGATSGKGGDIVVWTSATGAYGGLTLNGSVIKPRPEWNATYYGKSAPVMTILASGVKNPASRPLQSELSSVLR